MKKIVVTILTILLSVSLFATNNESKALKRLDKVIDLIKTNTIQTDFEMTAKNAGNKQSFKTKGQITLHADNFVLKTEQLKMFFNGKTQWIYSSEINEVTITNPTEKELGEVNPLLLLSNFRENSTISILKTNSKEVTLLLKPKRKTKTIFSKIVLKVNKTTNYPTFIQTQDKSGNDVVLRLKKIKKVKVNSKYFNFDEKKYKDLEINDLR